MIHRRIPRRSFLRGAGGAALAIPVLPSLLARPARAALRAPARRFVFVGAQYGRDIGAWYPEVEPDRSEQGAHYIELARARNAQGHISKIFSGRWDSLRDKISILRGLDGMDIKGNAHASAMALTASGKYKGTINFGYSADVVMGQSDAVYPEEPFVRSLRSSPIAKRPMSFSFQVSGGSTQALAYDADPLDTYNRLFHPDELAKRARRSSAQLPVLNGVLDAYKRTIGSSRISQADRHKLEAHVSLLSDVERNLGISVPRCDLAVAPDRDLRTSEAMHEAAMDLAVAALACGLTRIVTHAVLHHNSETSLNGGEAHSAAHGGRSRPAESGRAAVDQWRLNEWTMGRVARFLSKLDEMPDGEGTSLLDNTVFLHSNCEARGYHSFYDMPVIIAGSPDLFRLGYYVDYRPRPLFRFASKIYPGRPYNDVLVTMLHAMGLAPDAYQRFGQKGFGVYDGYDIALRSHYEPYMLRRDVPLPFVYR